MSTDPSGAAIQRNDAAIDDSPQAPSVSARDLVDLAAAIARVEALIAADASSQPDGSNPIERIADIAFVLHERDVEPSLCDVLDAAVREITAAGSLKEARDQRIRQAVEALRELLARVNEMIARADAALWAELPKTPPAARKPFSAGSKLGGEEAADVKLPVDDLFATDVGDDDEFAVLLRETLMPPTSAEEQANPSETGLNKMTSSVASRAKDPPVKGMSASPENAPAPALNPEDDPGDLFEPLASVPLAAPAQQKIEAVPLSAPVPAGIRAPERTDAAAGESVPQREENVQPPMPAAESGTFGVVLSVANPKPRLRIDTGSPPQPAPRTAPNDPMAPVHGLSEEEMIALFS